MTRMSWRRAAHSVPVVDRAIRRLRRTDEIVALQRQLVTAAAAVDASNPFLTRWPPGHFYSAIPDLEQIRAQARRLFTRPHSLPGLSLNGEAQLELLTELAPLARECHFPVDRSPSDRYFTNNPSYGIGDASILQAFLRLRQPKRYLEVGSGWTTALALDTNEQYLDRSIQITCIEPYPVDLRTLLRPGDPVEIIEAPVQDVPIARFAELGAGDVLFIDCSHVVKTGSDAHWLITRVLPSVPPGVHVHIHDIFWPFEYPQTWIEEGRAWSEAYLLHAFLLFNSSFEVQFFNDYLMAEHPERLIGEIPAMRSNGGGAIWLRRVG